MPTKKQRSRRRPAESSYSAESRLIYGRNVSGRWDFERHVVPPLSSSTNFRFRSASEGAAAFADFAARACGQDCRKWRFVYDRLDDPNKDLLEEHLAIAEEADISLVFSTGMAAISTLLTVLLGESAAPGRAERKRGSSELLVHLPAYGCTSDLVRKHLNERLRIPVRFVDLSVRGTLRASVTSSTRVVYCESPANPTCRLVDLADLASELAILNRGRRTPVVLVVDNTFASPFCQRPLTLGADFVCLSLTKSVGGFGTVMGGAVLANRRHLTTVGKLVQLRKDVGCSLSPYNAWHILVYGISTLPLRMRRMQDNAGVVAKFLQEHSRVRSVSYPGLASFPQYALARRQMHDYKGKFAPGNMLYFEMEGRTSDQRRRTASRVVNHIARDAYTITLAVSLGQIRSLVEYPGGMTHAVVDAKEQRKGKIDPGGIRMSVGIEEPDDLIRDLSAALER
ncbi:MAG: PLP-dependent transferase [bacterium]